jgi:hypothetical protein
MEHLLVFLAMMLTEENVHIPGLSEKNETPEGCVKKASPPT